MAKYMFLAPGLTLPFSPLSSEALEEIKRHAGRAWEQHMQEDASCSTTYSGAYGNKKLDGSAYCHVTPSSPTRIHKPHPTEVFLINRLHHLSGNYGNPKHGVTTDKGCQPSFLKSASNRKKFQQHSQKMNHNAVIIPSPAVPLYQIQQAMKYPRVKENQSEIKMGTSSAASQDILTGWPVTGSSDSMGLQIMEKVPQHPPDLN
ncbi:uncharacterized protein C4orf51 homolog [Zootoca vivipara]|uniref:uncharacterized protein C4orf51 homolog n=1 Tax=Zootoca vivipara TaxID=8524 RepID=UPI001591EE32|nr:uncharacterized protein C4orf51 homolog [Zootoca vivipara]